MASDTYHYEEPDLSLFIEPERIDDSGDQLNPLDASAAMRAPAALQPIKPSQSPAFVNQTYNSPSSDGDRIYTPKSENPQDEQDELYNLASPIQYGQQSLSPPVAWENAQDPIHELFDENIIYGDATMHDVFDEPAQQDLMQYQHVQPMQFAQPMTVVPHAQYIYSNGYAYAMPFHPMQPMMLQQAAPSMVQHQQFVQQPIQSSVQPAHQREQRPVRPARLLPAGLPMIKAEPSLTRRGVRNGKLSSQQRENTAETRKIGACWRCFLQRDVCVRTENGCCKRCIRAAADTPSLGLPCNNTKLPTLIIEFLPPSMQNIHHKQSIMDDVKKEVISWQSHRTVLSLSPGFGPDFTWTVYEFVPRSQNFLRQLQYFTDKDTRKMVHREKYSPPLGVKSIGHEDRDFSLYMDTLLDPSLPHLQGYARQAYASEIDQDPFPEEVLNLLVILHKDTRDATEY
ncbi:hypothetical protein AMS68_005392 [Peltaster fructicola]|uniref:Uncharacterized protein n=1 Tax=Peltaster fructicola TaxID=286661 RepID=A0A6H0XYY1_9PEZI|nr:hypothetical protein AMS68_005392 [Peltaster fructicola]